MSLFCIADLLCTQQELIDQLCAANDQMAAKHTELAEAHEQLCEKIADLVGDPDAECPPCPEATPLVEEAEEQTVAIKEQTVAIKEVTAAVAVRTLAVKSALSRTTVERKV